MRTNRIRKYKNSLNKTKKNKIKNKMSKPKRLNGEIYFKDFPDFRPNLSPRQIFKMGSFGGTYWRAIKSKFHNTILKNQHKKYPKSWWKGIPDAHLTRPFEKYDAKINKYGKKVGTTLQFWEDKGWIKQENPYGWVQWYCDFYLGKRGKDDERQIKRWKQLTGPNGRFRKWLVTQILKKGTKKDWNNHDISPAIRQTLQHWGYKLKKKDFNMELNNRKK
jgi:hypothetical protein